MPTATELKSSLLVATISVSLDQKELSVTSLQLTMLFDNGCSYQKVMSKKGDDSYMLQKGTGVQTVGSVTIVITKTPDGKYNDSISAFEEAAKDPQGNENLENYTKTFTFSFMTAGDKNFMNFTFAGYVKEFKADSREGNQFPQYSAEIVVTDSATVAIS